MGRPLYPPRKLFFDYGFSHVPRGHRNRSIAAQLTCTKQLQFLCPNYGRINVMTAHASASSSSCSVNRLETAVEDREMTCISTRSLSGLEPRTRPAGTCSKWSAKKNKLVVFQSKPCKNLTYRNEFCAPNTGNFLASFPSPVVWEWGQLQISAVTS